MSQNQVDDFNFEPRYICHSSISDFIKGNKKEKRNILGGDWPFKSYLCLFEDGDKAKDRDYVYDNNWNYQEGSNHPLADIPFCYTMKTLYYESGLNLEDMLDIDNFRISLEVDYQFFVEPGEPSLKNLEDDEIKADK